MAHLQKLISSSAASSSTAATPNSNHNYDVFVNGHRQEVKKTLASHLHHLLLLDGFRVFDQQEILEEGVSLNSQIRGAIATASVHVAIFSPRFAESKWCLEELVLMLESGKTIIPVFYHVKPSDLRIKAGNGEDGVYGRALLDLEKNSRNEPNSHTVWREALSRVADISGLELKACNGDEGELVDRVVQLVEEKVIETQLLAAYPIGLDEKLEAFKNMVLTQQQQQGVQTTIVGIVGSGGVGKTTLAIQFFERKRSDYKRSCFLYDVKGAAGRNSLHSLQNQLIKDLTSMDLEIINVSDGTENLSRSLFAFQALVILDDIDDVEQLFAFFPPGKEILRSGSLILVISRDRHVLEKSGIDDLSIYDLTGLNETHSQELFCLHAFHKRLPVLGFNEVVTQFLDACNGLPLFVKVFGALVYQKDLKYCETQLRKIAKILPATTIQGLKICYDSLDEQEKDAFLDIACFFINEDKDMAITIWDASGWEGRLNLENLQNYCLVDINSKNCIRMHDLLRDLGRDLAEKERFNCRLWRPTDNLAFHGAFQQSTVRGVNMVQGSSDSSFDNPVNPNNSFVDLSRLQLLRAEGDCLGSISNHLTHSDILWLCWNSYPSANLPPWNPVRNLRVLQVAGSELKMLWMDENEAPLELRELYIRADVLRFPKSIGQLWKLEKIEAKAAIIEPLTEEFCLLRSLKHLSLRTRMNLEDHPLYGDYSHLEMLPESFGNLRNLQHLDLSGCSHLQMLPNSFGNLRNLSHLDLSSCSHLQMLPDSFGNLSNLSHLDLYRCSGLQMLPDSLGNLSNLSHLDLFACSRLQMLPDSLGNLSNLSHLDLSGCSCLQMLPDSLGNLSNLSHLDLSGCSCLQMLPDSLGNLSNLSHLHLSGCSGLQMLPDSLGNLSNLSHLDLSGCSHLQMLPNSFGNLRNLSHLRLSGCSHLQMLPDSLGNLSNLSYLNLFACSRLEMLPDSFRNLKKLSHLDLSECHRLETSPDLFENLRKLQHLALPKSFGNPLTVTSTKKMVFKVAMVDGKSKRRVMKSLAAVEGVESVAVDMKEKNITVLGDADPVIVLGKLRKLGFAELLSVGLAEEEKEKAVEKRYNKGKEKAVDQRNKTELLSLGPAQEEKRVKSCTVM